MTDALDLVVIGSSPLLLLVAARAQQRGRRVLVLEAADRLGGAWTSSEFGGLPHVEEGAHYIYGSPRTYREFAKAGVVFGRMDPQPFAMIYGRKAPISFLQKYHRLGETFADRRYRELPFEMRRLLTYRDYRYPVGGAAGLIDELHAVVGASRVRIGASVRGVRMDRPDSPLVEVHTDGAVTRALRVVTGQGLNSCRIDIGERSWDVESQPTRKTHLQLLLPARWTRDISYVHFLGHPLLRRVSRASRGPARDRIAWSVELSSSAASDLAPEQLSRRAVAALARADLLRREEILEFSVMEFRGTVMAPGQEWVPAMGRRLDVLPSWACLGDSVELILGTAHKKLLVD